MEAHIRNQTPTLTDSLIRHYFNVAVPHLFHIDPVYLCESTLYSDVLGLAGRCDITANWDGKLSIVDWKTSRRLKTKEEILNYFLQGCFYSLMVREMYGVFPEQIVIFIVSEEIDRPLIFVEDPKRYVRQCLDLVDSHHTPIVGRLRG